VQTAKLYDRTAWVSLLGLRTTDVAPLSGRNAYGLAACLATSGGFVAMFGATPPREVYRLASEFQLTLSYKPGSTQDRIAGEYM
jgi:hypothetical protein